LLTGTLGSALVGPIGAWFYLGNTPRDSRSDCALSTAMVLTRLALSIVGILRQIAALGRASDV
jgi:hypothetical protein